VADAELPASVIEAFGAVAVAIVGHDAFDADTVFSKELHGSDEEVRAGVLTLVV